MIFSICKQKDWVSRTEMNFTLKDAIKDYPFTSKKIKNCSLTTNNYLIRKFKLNGHILPCFSALDGIYYFLF